VESFGACKSFFKVRKGLRRIALTPATVMGEPSAVIIFQELEQGVQVEKEIEEKVI